ncbi:MAG: cytochrome c biogenesis protein CcdA [Promethearchaeota archaeon]
MRRIVFSALIIVGLAILVLILVFAPPPASTTNKQSITNELNMKVQTLNGTEFYLADYLGQPLILDLFATWCAPCKQQVIILKEFIKSHSDITIISISVDPAYDTLERLTAYQLENNITWEFGQDVELQGNTMFGANYLPTVVYIDSYGIQQQIKNQLVSLSELEEWISGTQSQSTTFVIFGFEVESTIGLPLFFLVGLYVALSPCLFPIMPITLFHVLNKQSREKRSEEEKGEGIGDSEEDFSVKRSEALQWVFMLWSGILFSFGIFALVGVAIGFLLIQYYTVLNLIFGFLIVILGIIILIPKFGEQIFARIPVPDRLSGLLQKETVSDLDLFILGLSYSIIALPCAGPAFLAVLPLIIGSINPLFTLTGLVLLALGLLLPYLALVMLTTEARTRFISGIQRHYGLIKVITAVFLIIIGALLMWPFFGGPALFAI